ncbi:hypothetical protein FOXB_17039 [Fusarium oxysporum f. sp. conglutinans Fo5176]|uniref:Uncharacterized protein n=1 Tax=Fusarium oxysporum (strain Fo5176) TaxID=660025 RepID=F9GEF5_FUSOF|nr:hypothetical protein FOXB_17039 [Fusarium oxysporum f. sp. conglutinans Fo5176]
MRPNRWILALRHPTSSSLFIDIVCVCTADFETDA